MKIIFTAMLATILFSACSTNQAESDNGQADSTSLMTDTADNTLLDSMTIRDTVQTPDTTKERQRQFEQR